MLNVFKAKIAACYLEQSAVTIIILLIAPSSGPSVYVMSNISNIRSIKPKKAPA